MPSSVIDHFKYLPDTEILRVTFISGSVYVYKGVPQRIYDQIKAARSKGKYLNRYIKGRFPFEKVLKDGQ
jgi:hypothetical protein